MVQIYNRYNIYILINKRSAAKNAINTIWSRFILKDEIPLSAKYRVFDASVRSIACYASQVWGFQVDEELEKLQRFFIKKLFGLPTNTPNYMLYLESGRNPLFLFTLRIHFNYIQKILQLPEHRLPKILATEVIKKESLWFAEWKNLSRKYNSEIGEDITKWGKQLGELLAKMETVYREEFEIRARQATYHRVYTKLSYNLGNKNYMNEENNLKKMKMIIKARGELFNFTYKPWKQTEIVDCPLCNTKQPDDFIHFLADCPILIETRKLYLGFATLKEDQIICLLNGSNWGALFAYLKSTFCYRNEILNYFV